MSKAGKDRERRQILPGESAKDMLRSYSLQGVAEQVDSC